MGTKDRLHELHASLIGQQPAPPIARHWGLLSHPTNDPIPLSIEPRPPNPGEAVHLLADSRFYGVALRLVDEHNALVDEVGRLRVKADTGRRMDGQG